VTPGWNRRRVELTVTARFLQDFQFSVLQLSLTPFLAPLVLSPVQMLLDGNLKPKLLITVQLL
jgi:hypothetical protein